jgi:hypothetical protein
MVSKCWSNLDLRLSLISQFRRFVASMSTSDVKHTSAIAFGGSFLIASNYRFICDISLASPLPFSAPRVAKCGTQSSNQL